jgi:hypothetical protein
VTGGDLFELGAREIVTNCVREDEVTVRQSLHQRAGTEAIRAVIGEVRLANHVQARDRAHQVVVDPQSAHRVVRGRKDAHRDLVRVLVSDALIHLEQVAVLLLNGAAAEPLDGIAEIQVDAEAGRTDAPPLVANLLRGPGRDIARAQIPEARYLRSR